LLCFDREPDAVFLGCGHGGVCYQCAMDTFVAHREVRAICIQLSFIEASIPFIVMIKTASPTARRLLPF
jgi:hypothetical protein